MKYIVILGDGMADRPIATLDNKTPLEAAKKPHIDYCAQKGQCGMVTTIPKGMTPGSDVANLSVMGYNPVEFYSGRSPLEALSMGIKMGKDDIALRCNLVTLSDESDYSAKTMLDYSAGDISTSDAKELISAVEKALGSDTLSFHGGISYRHCLIEKGGELYDKLSAPHDITNKVISEYLPTYPHLLELMKASYDILNDHPINIARKERNQKPANSIWLWGAGSKPALPDYATLYNKKAAVISAVDLLRGIGIAGNMKVINVEGATGKIDTNYKGKADACIKALADGCDYVYLHIEAPDECGHQGLASQKVKAIELIDSKIVGYIMEKLEHEDYTMLICPDHATPTELMSHTDEPVPYILYRNNHERDSSLKSYTEAECTLSGYNYDSGEALAQGMFDNNFTPDSIDLLSVAPIVNSTKKGKADKVNKATGNKDIPADGDLLPSEVDNDALSSENATTNSLAGATATEKSPKKKKSKSSTAPSDDAKKKKLLAIILAVAILTIILIVSIVTPIAVLNKGKIFIKEAGDFQNVNKGTYYVLEKDIIVDGDLTLANPYSIDLNKHVLKVNGKLSFTHTQVDKTINIGTKKGKVFVLGGAIEADMIDFACTGTVIVDAAVTAQELKINADNTVFNNGITAHASLNITGGTHQFNSNLVFGENGKTNITNANKVIITKDGMADFIVNGSNVEMMSATETKSLTLDATSNLKTHGKTLGNITGGAVVIMTANATADRVSGMELLWITHGNKHANVISVDDSKIKYIINLETPIDISLERTAAGKILVSATKVNYADRYAFFVNDNEPLYVSDSSSNTGIVTCDITALANTAGNHIVKVQALGADGADTDLIVPSGFIKLNYTHQVKLDMPSGLAVHVNSDKSVYLSFNAVSFADEYLITINGKNIVYQDVDNLSINITEHVAAVGAYSIRVQARSAKNSAMTSSDVAMTSYESIRPHDGTINAALTTADDGSVTLEWNSLATAVRYTITHTSNGISTTYKVHANSYTFAAGFLKAGDTITVRADSLGYYQNSLDSNIIIIA